MIVEDYEALQKRARALRLRCAVKESRPVAECWCYMQGRGGAHLPCPDAPMPETEDPLGDVRARIRQLFGPPFWQEPR
jgi:hypothetical protein